MYYSGGDHAGIRTSKINFHYGENPRVEVLRLDNEALGKIDKFECTSSFRWSSCRRVYLYFWRHDERTR